MTIINAKSTKTIATRIRSKTLSYFKCIKFESTKKAFKPAMSNAIVTVNAPNCIEVIDIVRNVRNIRTKSILLKVLYSIVCVVLFAI